MITHCLRCGVDADYCNCEIPEMTLLERPAHIGFPQLQQGSTDSPEILAANIQARKDAESLVKDLEQQTERFWEVLATLAIGKVAAIVRSHLISSSAAQDVMTEQETRQFEIHGMPTYTQYFPMSVGEVAELDI